MSVPMKKHHISVRKNILHVVYNENVYNIPKPVADRYKVISNKESTGKLSEDAISAEHFFAELDRQYTKPGVLLRGLRVRENLSQIEFSEKIGVTQSDLSKMELGKRPIGKTIAQRIAKKFGIHYRSLLG